MSHKRKLRAREGHFIRERGTLNKQIAGRTYHEWCKDNENHINSKWETIHNKTIQNTLTNKRNNITKTIKSILINT